MYLYSILSFMLNIVYQIISSYFFSYALQKLSALILIMSYIYNSSFRTFWYFGGADTFRHVVKNTVPKCVVCTAHRRLKDEVKIISETSNIQ